MTKEELYHYMLAYQQEHQFNKKEHSNFITMLNTLKVENNKPNENQNSKTKNNYDDRGETL